MRRQLTIAALWLAISLTAFNTYAQRKASFKLGNTLIEFSFDPNSGKYMITDKRDHSVCVENAAFKINQYSSDGGLIYQYKIENISDELGHGNKISIEGKKAGQPSLLFEACIYDHKGFISLNEGIDNTTGAALRVMQFFPLKGIAFKSAHFDNFRVLDGENGTYFTQVSGKDTLTSNNNLLATFGLKNARKRSLVMGGLTYHEFRKYASVRRRSDFLEIELKADDPVGKLIDAGSRYMFKDKFYLDISTDNRFESLEKYGLALSRANKVDIKGVTIPILNFWYCFEPRYGGNEFRDNSTGTINEMAEVVKSGFLKYTPVGIRLEPDDYSFPNNQQGWWDDQHWQMYKGGQLLPPYETIVKWGKKLKEMGAVPFIYGQTARRSEDYAIQHPDQMLFNSAVKERSKGLMGWWKTLGDTTTKYWTYDFTDPGFIKHMQSTYQNLKDGGVRGIKFDYPETGWAYDGGFEDKYATTTSAYRNIFKLAYDGLGPGRDVQERIPLYGDITLGVSTTQRTEGDNDRVYPARIAKTGLRWYKNRMVINYDCDPINPYHTYPDNTRDGWRAAITMTYTTSGRMEIGKYFERMDSSMRYDLSRAVPLLTDPIVSPKPIDAFSGKLYPEVYDFTINPDWHIVTFYNAHIKGETWPTDVSYYGEKKQQFVPKEMIPATVSVSIGDRTDDGGLGLDSKRKYYIFDFWNWKYIGKLTGNAKLTQQLRAGEARVMAVHQAKSYPQFLSTSRHIYQGYLDMVKYPEWDKNRSRLSGISSLIANETYKIIIANNGHPVNKYTAPGASCSLILLDKKNGIYELDITANNNKDIAWEITFK